MSQARPNFFDWLLIRVFLIDIFISLLRYLEHIFSTFSQFFDPTRLTPLFSVGLLKTPQCKYHSEPYFNDVDVTHLYFHLSAS